MKRRLIWVLAALAAVAIVVGGCGSSGEGSGTTAGSGSATAESPPTDSTTAEQPTTEQPTESTAPELATSDLTKAQFVKQANAICVKGNEAITDQFEAFLEKNDVPEDRLPSTKELKEVAETIIAPVVGNQVEEIRALGAPAGEEEQIEEFLAAAEEGIEKSKEEPKALLNDKGSPFDKANELSREYGLKACSE